MGMGEQIVMNLQANGNRSCGHPLDQLLAATKSVAGLAIPHDCAEDQSSINLSRFVKALPRRSSRNHVRRKMSAAQMSLQFKRETERIIIFNGNHHVQSTTLDVRQQHPQPLDARRPADRRRGHSAEVLVRPKRSRHRPHRQQPQLRHARRSRRARPDTAGICCSTCCRRWFTCVTSSERSRRAAMAGEAARLREMNEDHPGGLLVTTQLAQLMFVQALRAAPGDSGAARWRMAKGPWRRTHRRGAAPDARRSQRALGRWKKLAKAAGMSRTTFALRFKTVVGVAPLAYLLAWRMHLAERDLRESERPVSAIAFCAGLHIGKRVQQRVQTREGPRTEALPHGVQELCSTSGEYVTALVFAGGTHDVRCLHQRLPTQSQSDMPSGVLISETSFTRSA